MAAKINTQKGATPSKAHQKAVDNAWSGGLQNGSTNATQMSKKAFEQGKCDPKDFKK